MRMINVNVIDVTQKEGNVKLPVEKRKISLATIKKAYSVS